MNPLYVLLAIAFLVYVVVRLGYHVCYEIPRDREIIDRRESHARS